MVGLDDLSLTVDNVGSWVLCFKDGLNTCKIAQNRGESIQD